MGGNRTTVPSLAAPASTQTQPPPPLAPSAAGLPRCGRRTPVRAARPPGLRQPLSPQRAACHRQIRQSPRGPRAAAAAAGSSEQAGLWAAGQQCGCSAWRPQRGWSGAQPRPAGPHPLGGAPRTAPALAAAAERCTLRPQTCQKDRRERRCIRQERQQKHNRKEVLYPSAVVGRPPTPSTVIPTEITERPPVTSSSASEPAATARILRCASAPPLLPPVGRKTGSNSRPTG